MSVCTTYIIVFIIFTRRRRDGAYVCTISICGRKEVSEPSGWMTSIWLGTSSHLYCVVVVVVIVVVPTREHSSRSHHVLYIIYVYMLEDTAFCPLPLRACRNVQMHKSCSSVRWEFFLRVVFFFFFFLSLGEF